MKGRREKKEMNEVRRMVEEKTEWNKKRKEGGKKVG